jgi:hypothetical protein
MGVVGQDEIHPPQSIRMDDHWRATEPGMTIGLHVPVRSSTIARGATLRP